MHFLTKIFLPQNLVTFLYKLKKNICDKKVTKVLVQKKNNFVKKCIFYGINVAVISKYFEIITGKSQNLIVQINYNTHVPVLSKNNLFLNFMTNREGHLVPKKRTFLGDRNFWPIMWPEVPKFGRVEKNCWFGQDFQGFVF